MRALALEKYTKKRIIKNNMTTLKQKISSKTARISVIGLGYVGLPLALAIRDAGFFVSGIDTDHKKITLLKAKKSYIDDITDAEVKNAIDTQKFVPTDSFTALRVSDIVIIAVPTPLDKYKVPDLKYIEKAAQNASIHLHKNQLIILESTTYPGTTEEVVLPLLNLSPSIIGEKPTKLVHENHLGNARLEVGRDFYLAFSPERVDPGNKQFTIKNTPKVVGGVTSHCTKIAQNFYSKVIQTVVPVSSAKTAEMTKLLENIFRIVNISMINELALLASKMDIDIWEVIQAASTKPYGFMPFYPGPGIGGHCIAVDPFYLSYKAREYGFFTRFIDLAGEINELMPHFVVTKVDAALNYTQKKSINGSRILILGVSYKKDIKDTRESAAYAIAEMLHKKGARLSFFDPYIKNFVINKENSASINIPALKKLTKQTITRYNAILIITDHSEKSLGVEYETIAQWAKIIIDTRNVIKNRSLKNIYRL